MDLMYLGRIIGLVDDLEYKEKGIINDNSKIFIFVRHSATSVLVSWYLKKALKEKKIYYMFSYKHSTGF